MGLKKKCLDEQVALVTGGGSGIGRAFAEALAVTGATVVVASRRDELLRRAAAEINESVGSERVFPRQLDIRDLAQIDFLVSDLIERWQTIDVLVNNSGLAVPETVDRITQAGWDNVLE